jgi:hypothetical protein
VHDFFGRHLRLNGVQEADELLVTMALHKSANDLAFEDIESSEQRRCAMALVVVGHRAGSAFLHQQAGLGAVERHTAVAATDASSSTARAAFPFVLALTEVAITHYRSTLKPRAMCVAKCRRGRRLRRPSQVSIYLRLLGMLGERKPSFGHFDENGLVCRRAAASANRMQSAALVRNWTNVSKRVSIPCIIPCIWGLTELFA